MSSDSSVTVSTGSRVRQFGLYRTIDARTEEFLRLSKKKQIRQGCACAAVSTAITVTVVIILLIYEYVIAAEWDSTLNRSNNIDDTYMNDQPTANRLYRSYFGFDQNYYERMPLLVNAMQENSYIDPSLDVIPAMKVDKFNKANTKSSITGNLISSNIKKTSPRPFHYATSTSSPLSKTYGSRNWIEKYRNAQRLQNIRQIIKYLEKTINAKVGDLDSKTPNSHVAFSGVYVEPMVTKNQGKQNTELDLMHQGSMLTNVIRPNDYFTPLVNYIPDNPGQVNLLADNLLNFSPYPSLRVKDTTSRKPLMFRRISNYNKNCMNNNNCKENINDERYLNSDTENDNPNKFSATTAKSFSVMLNLFPLKSALNSDYRGRIFNRNSQASIDDIYLTTTRPVVKFKRKSTTPTTRRFLRKKPRVLIQNRVGKENKLKNLDVSHNIEPISDVGTKMIVHVQVYTPEATTKVDSEFDSLRPNLTESPPLYWSDTPMQLTSNQVEDFHVGSSGVIPIIENITPSTTSTEPVHPFSDMTIKAEPPRTSRPNILTFSHEDAKIPEHYLNDHKHENEITTEIIGKSTEKNIGENSNGVVEMLVIKLKNSLCNETTITESTTQTDKDFKGATTPWPYVPLTNGHYRSMNPHSIDSHFLGDFENLNKRNDEISDRKSSYTPTYVEIRRNYTRKNEGVD